MIGYIKKECVKNSMEAKLCHNLLEKVDNPDNPSKVEETQVKLIEDTYNDKIGYYPWVLLNYGRKRFKNPIFKQFNLHLEEFAVRRESKLVNSKENVVDKPDAGKVSISFNIPINGNKINALFDVAKEGELIQSKLGDVMFFEVTDATGASGLIPLNGDIVEMGSKEAFGDGKSSFVQVAKTMAKTSMPLNVNEGGNLSSKKESEVIGVWVEGSSGMFFQKIEYERIPNFCFNYGMIGYIKKDCVKNSMEDKLGSNLLEKVDNPDNPTMVEETHEKLIEDAYNDKIGYSPWVLVNYGRKRFKNPIFKQFNQHLVEVDVRRESKLVNYKENVGDLINSVQVDKLDAGKVSVSCNIPITASAICSGLLMGYGGGDRRSPPCHPSRSGGGGEGGGSDRERKGANRGVGGRSGSRDGGRIIAGTEAGNSDGRCGERRRSFGSTRGLAKIGAGGSRLVQDRSNADVWGAEPEASRQGTDASQLNTCGIVISSSDGFRGKRIMRWRMWCCMILRSRMKSWRYARRGDIQEGLLNPKKEELRDSNERGEVVQNMDTPAQELSVNAVNFGGMSHSYNLMMVGRRNWKDINKVMSPSQKLIPKLLKFSESKSGVLKPKLNQGRNSIVTKEIAQIGSILKMPRMRRKANDAELSASTFEHLLV
ncbi:hypothetical protein MA16_Dca026819 [Dendrobium catenatum]|uniref:Uncharacterized protein n=1 Tax=Dendrobium catenatum TaxID=906689 RepID=A0A2I0WC08_9ASPA|nr:hypothetical protein MA16_Dca026819 [Dendrobium catenatum]